jgi:hypothetical protein
MEASRQINNEGDHADAVEGVADVATITYHFSSLTERLLHSLDDPLVVILSTLTSWSPADST